MRRLKRKIAHYKMEKMGVKHMNKSARVGGRTIPSFFSQNWEKYANISINKITN